MHPSVSVSWLMVDAVIVDNGSAETGRGSPKEFGAAHPAAQPGVAESSANGVEVHHDV